jgi:hypothetical protein
MGKTVGTRRGFTGAFARLRGVAIAATVAVLAATFVAVQAPDVANAANPTASSPCGANINAIVCENQKTGTDPSVWDIDGAGDASIQGYATDISVNAGQKIDFKIDTKATSYKIDVYRTGWYQGKGARFIQSVPVTASLPQNQPQCISDVTTELYDCGTWGVSASWNVPSDAVSGVYIAKLTRNDTGGASHIIFIVRNDGNTSQVLFQTSDPTWHAYNTYGGSDFYQGAANGRAYKISYNRPFATRGLQSGRDFYFSSEYATVRFLERNGYDMSYIAGLDTDRRGGELLNHKVFLSVGHDEYWSGAQRANIEAARDAKVNLQFLTGNEGYWRTRYENSVDGSNTPNRTLVSYKETWGNATNKDGGKIDPSSEWTGTYRDPRFATVEQGAGQPENALTGTMYMVNHNELAVTVTGDEGKNRLWRGTDLTGLAATTSVALAPRTVGYESNEDIDNGFRPDGLIRLSTTVGPTPQYLTDYGNTVVEGTTTHHLTMYKAASGALVFSAASIQWGWGLDPEHDGGGTPADARMQQAQVNLLADMDAQPGSLMSGLVTATKSTDTTAPTTTITSPTAGQAIAHGTSVTVTGTAADTGGRVAGVEVSTDGGDTWHAANGTTSWNYTFVQQGSGATVITARAIDDSANYTAAGVSVTVNVGGPYSVFGSAVPAVAATTDGYGAELGLRFSAQVDGFVSGVRFYKGAGNDGQHVGTLWSAQGLRLGTVTFVNESASGWQTALFAAPVPVIAGQQYTVSYTAPKGHYPYEEWYWPYKNRATAPLSTPTVSGANGAGVYGDTGTFPATTYRDTNYFVDVVFEAAQDSPVRLTSQVPASGVNGVAKDSIISTMFTRPVVPASVKITVTGPAGVVAGSTSYDAATRRARFVPAAPLSPVTSYTVVVVAVPVDATTFQPGDAWTFTTANDSASNSCPCTLYTSSDVPPIASAPDDRVTVGTRFSVLEAGFISGISFYKGAGNTGTHVGSLWSDGQELGQVTFTNETASGWQTARLASPIAVNPGAEYVVSYVAPAGGYAVGAAAFASGVTRGPLVVPASGGAYTYAGGFPGRTSTTSYYVDPVFVRSISGPQLVSTTPTAGATAVARNTTIDATFTEPLSTVPTVAVTASGASVGGAATLSSDRKTVSFTTSAPLPYDAAISVTVSGIVGGSGASTDSSWTFQTAPNAAPVNVTFFGSAAPAVATAADGTPVELGMAFQTTLQGRITALRFYKAAGDAGTHTGTLWSSSGRALATVAFQNESADGWQRAELSAPVIIDPGQTYTVSYTSSLGTYAYARNFFTSPAVSGPLTAPAQGNGTFRYGTGGTMPQSSFGASNYFADVEFSSGTSDAPTLSVTGKTPEGTAVAFNAAPTATLSTDAPSARIELRAGTTAVAGASVYDAANRKVTFTPTAPLTELTTYTATVRVGGQTLDEWNFKTKAPELAGVVGTLFGQDAPAVAATDDTTPVEVGTRFTVAYAAKATAIRFYKGAGNTGVHVGHLWNAAGEQIATVEFTSETDSGWQRAALTTPVDLTPGQTYTVSYFAPNGRYASAAGYFAQPVTNGYVTGPAGDNGRFGLAGGVFPDRSWNSTAYFVDAEVTFTGDVPVPPVTLSAASPAKDATGVALSAPVSATLANAVSATIGVKKDGATIAGASTFDSATGIVAFTPSAPWERGAVYAVSVTANGSAVTDGSWSFTTVANAAIATRTPGADAAGVGATAAITATLTNAASASIALTSGGSAVAGASAFDAATGIVTFTPTAALLRGSTYQVTVTANGAPVASGVWSFSTVPNPALTARTPAASATNIDPTAAGITATVANASTASLTVTSNGTAVAGASTFDPATGIVRFTPTAALQWGRTYTVAPSADGAALSGGAWTFSTLPVTTLTARTPAVNATNVDPSSPKITATLTGAVSAAMTLAQGTTAVAGTAALNRSTGVVTFTPAAALDYGKTYTVTVVGNGTAVSGGTWSFSTAASPTITARTPAASATGIDPATAKITATLSAATTATLTVKAAGVDVAGSSAYNASTRTVTFTPSAALDRARTYTVTVTANGVAVTGGAWSFTTKSATSTIFATSAAPANANTSISQAVQIGTRFKTSVTGVVTAIRFYKGNQNTGTHTGYLWSSNGTRLATVTFSNETASGWQTATLSTPVRLTVGTEYRVSMYSSSGRYPSTTNGLSAVTTSGPLSTIASGGAYVYGTTYPSTTSTTNFWVDVIFDPDN